MIDQVVGLYLFGMGVLYGVVLQDITERLGIAYASWRLSWCLFFLAALWPILLPIAVAYDTLNKIRKRL